MTKEQEKKLITSKDLGMVKNISLQGRLILRLLGDRRVSFLAKLLPLSAIIYFIVPDLVPFILDDAALVGLGTYIFMELCPPAVVEEHRKALYGELAPSKVAENEEVVDVEFKEKDA